MSNAISLIIPTYNERDNITPLVKRIDGVLSGHDYEVVFVDDNSSDGTAELVAALSARYPLRVVVRRHKRGYIPGSPVVTINQGNQGPYVGLLHAQKRSGGQCRPETNRF